MIESIPRLVFVDLTENKYGWEYKEFDDIEEIITERFPRSLNRNVKFNKNNYDEINIATQDADIIFVVGHGNEMDHTVDLFGKGAPKTMGCKYPEVFNSFFFIAQMLPEPNNPFLIIHCICYGSCEEALFASTTFGNLLGLIDTTTPVNLQYQRNAIIDLLTLLKINFKSIYSTAEDVERTFNFWKGRNAGIVDCFQFHITPSINEVLKEIQRENT